MSQIKYINGDILTANNLPEFVAICHQVNCQGVMGAGLAKQIRDKYPMVYTTYRKYCLDKNINPPQLSKSPLLGKIQVLYPEKGTLNPEYYHFCIINCFGQNGYGYESVQTDYAAVKECFRKINEVFSGKRVAIPFKFGCGLAGGDWNIVLSLIEKELKDCLVEIWEYSPKN